MSEMIESLRSDLAALNEAGPSGSALKLLNVIADEGLQAII